MTETPLIFECAGARLVGILHRPERPRATAVVIVVGGPQYRVGAHRSFLCLARALAARGHAVLRFDCRGMGDSEGAHPGFTGSGPDIDAAVGALFETVPEARQAVLLGLCDGATAAALHARHNDRVAGLVLLNPWVRDEQGYEAVLLRHYYVRRLFERDFWRRLRAGRVALLDFPALLLRVAKRRFGRQPTTGSPVTLARRMLDGLAVFEGRILLLSSGQDLTAREFEDAMAALPDWSDFAARPEFRQVRLPGADHSLSGEGDLAGAVDIVLAWLDEGELGPARSAIRR